MAAETPGTGGIKENAVMPDDSATTVDRVGLEIAGKKVTVLPGPKGSPAVYLNSYADNGETIRCMLTEQGCTHHSLIVISRLNWEDDMTPWYCPSLFRQSAPCGGKADAWLQTMEDQIVPEVERVLGEVPAYRAVVGYSLGGLFALYALYRTELFSASASVSGSLWYPSFREYVSGHVMRRRPDCIYISLGDREARTRHPLMRTVKEKTEQIAGDFRRAGIETALEWNRGNHAQDAEERTVKGIRWLLMHGKDSRGEAEN